VTEISGSVNLTNYTRVVDPQVIVTPSVSKVNETVISTTTIEVIKPTVDTDDETIDITETKTITYEKPIH